MTKCRRFGRILTVILNSYLRTDKARSASDHPLNGGCAYWFKRQNRSGQIKSSSITLHASVSLSIFHAAFAGDVEGRQMLSRPSTGAVYFWYSRHAVFPFVYMCLMSPAFRIAERSFAATFLMLESDEPSISQEAITSQAAIRCLSRNAPLSGTVSGKLSRKTAANTFQ